MQLSSIENVIFDFDHTLVDTDKAFTTYSQKLAEQLQRTTGLDADLIAIAIADTTARLKTQFFAGRLDSIKNETVSERLRALSEIERNRILMNVKGAYHESLRVSEPILVMINKILRAGKHVYVFTGGSPAHTKDKLVGSNLWQYFKTIFTGDFHPFEDRSDSGVFNESVKPELRLFQQLPPVISLGPNPKSSAIGYRVLVEQARLDAGRTLMVGNHLHDDIKNAHLAGLHTAQATWYMLDKSEGSAPDMVLAEPILLF